MHISAITGPPLDVKKTLDLRHTAHLNCVRNKRHRLEILRHKLRLVRNEIVALEERPRSTWVDEDFSAYSSLHDDEYVLKHSIVETDVGADENEYYLRAGSILYKYYNIVEDGGAAPMPPTSPPPSSAAPAPVAAAAETVGGHRAPASKGILAYFSSASQGASCGGGGGISSVGGVGIGDSYHGPRVLGDSSDRATLLDQYMSTAFTEGPLRSISHDSTRSKHDMASSSSSIGSGASSASSSDLDGGMECAHCGSVSHILNMQDGCIVCLSCHSIEYVIVDHDKPVYKDPPKDVACFAYKRINHLNEWLNQVQGKETTEIPEEVFMNIITEIKKQKITNMATLTTKKIRSILKKIDSNKYYEHIPHIIYRLNGIPAVHMPPELEDKVRFMFCTIQIPFLKYQPPNRKNFLSYSYCLHKMMQLLDKDQYLVNFPLLKSREKLYQQDQIWKKICGDVKWDFIPSL